MTTLLVPDTSTMEDRRRLLEQAGLRKFGAHINTKNRPEDRASIAPDPEQAPQNDIAEHPLLNNPRYDGIDPDLNPLPPLNTDARREMENELRLQHQKKLEKINQPTASPTPTLRR